MRKQQRVTLVPYYMGLKTGMAGSIPRHSNHSELSTGSSESSRTHGSVIELAKTEGRDSAKCLACTWTQVLFEKGKTSSPGRTKDRFVGSDVLPHQAKLLGACPAEFMWATKRNRVLHGYQASSICIRKTYIRTVPPVIL